MAVILLLSYLASSLVPGCLVADIAPVVDGQVQVSAASRVPYGGRQLTEHLQQLLAMRGSRGGGGAAAAANLGPVALSFEAAEALKKAVLRVVPESSGTGGGGSSDAAADLADAAAAAALGGPAAAANSLASALTGTAVAAQPTTHTLPDGQTITVAGEGAALGEALLHPSLMGLDLPPLAALAQASVQALEDRAVRRVAGEGVVVCGAGGAPVDGGLALRLLREMRLRTPAGQALTLAPLADYLPPQARGALRGG